MGGASNPMHRLQEFYMAALARAPREVCGDFCKMILQDAVCFGYKLPDLCTSCGLQGGNRSQAQVLDPLRGHFEETWRARYRRANCQFFRETGAWGGDLQVKWWCRDQPDFLTKRQ